MIDYRRRRTRERVRRARASQTSRLLGLWIASLATCWHISTIPTGYALPVALLAGVLVSLGMSSCLLLVWVEPIPEEEV